MKIVRFAAFLSVLSLLFLHATPIGAAQEDRRVKIINDSSRSVYHLYISNIDTDRWGEDLLGILETIGPNRYRVFNVDDGTGHCRFDFKAVMEDRSEAVRRNLNVCTQSSWTITD
jgi:hypothetical protein